MWKDTKAESVSFGETQGDLLKQWNAIRKQRKQLDDDEREIKNKLREYMGENEQGENENFKVTWKPQKRNTFDKKQFEKDNPELAKKYIKQSESRVFKISEM